MEDYYNDDDDNFNLVDEELINDDIDDVDDDDEGGVEYNDDNEEEEEGEEQDDEFVSTFKDIERTGGGEKKGKRDFITSDKKDAYTTKIYLLLRDIFGWDAGDIDEFIKTKVSIIKNYQHKNIYTIIAAIQYVDTYDYDISDDNIDRLLKKPHIKGNVDASDLVRYIRMLEFQKSKSTKSKSTKSKSTKSRKM